MKFLNGILAYVLLEFKLEFRSKFALASLLMYVLSTIYLVYFSLEYQALKADLLPALWAVFFWLITLFTTVNATFRSFSKEGSSRMLFYYTLLDAKTFVLAKIFFNAIVSWVLSVVSALMFIVVLGNPIQNLGIFFLSLSIGTLGYSILFTYISAIAARSGANASLSVILGFPLAIPLLTIIVKLFGESFKTIPSSNFDNNLWIALAFNFIPMLLSLVLFPYIWRD
ncbi:MAG: heme exporter protein CcmB [Chitinophagales bacterium]|nr:heme exporter protein CcmB [Bacteroidota bacterium]MCB9256520.1 heme exporter protein CcmB [Chitinophagales bacterium]